MSSGERICDVCSSSNVVNDPGNGSLVCIDCGSVIEEDAIVSEVTFAETSTGAAVVTGTYLSGDAVRARGTGPYRNGAPGPESREQTLANGRRRMRELANSLSIEERVTDAASRWFTLAIHSTFNRGRKTDHVVAACLYLACRHNKMTLMLIDFSDLLQVNVFVLGQTYLKLVKNLNMSERVPLVDPSIYIQRFAALLEFGKDTTQVSLDASRLIQRMDRDWMLTGRRPAGVCGAALVIAARMNDYRRTLLEVTQVVKIADITLRKRLDEFRQTQSSDLTVEEFRAVWLSESRDPPAFIQGQLRSTNEISDAELNKLIGSDGEEPETDGEAIASARERLRSRSCSVQPDDHRARSVSVERVLEKHPDVIEDAEGFKVPAVPKRPRSPSPIEKQNERVAEVVISDDIYAHLSEPTLQEKLNELDRQETEKEHRMAAERERERQRKEKGESAETDEQQALLDAAGSLSDLDEDELDEYILSAADREAKTRLWITFNRDYLENAAAKQRNADEEGKPRPKPRARKRKKEEDSPGLPAATAGEAATIMLQSKKRVSKKLNYDVVSRLLQETEDSARAAASGDSSLASSLNGSRNPTPFHGSDDDEDEDGFEEHTGIDDEDREWQALQASNAPEEFEIEGEL
ncbi:uncharacterized protein L969DRAFT_394393 [Mixia osmundae IAM 14324]|uniref:B-related factor 1 n=1 Tax=Mixia osmundae (strain CBS 9802 / IAM 14324 / JCM 22182 / KY 12970) TaxID=764103 RepID=G7E9N4_MIXOS|nr:uncharacterized protein L969DRAFT_394393 [Mixia osmundae IAM 14324]KEI39983.1 hypothetical protein L969DRAFT_394393 [Mixia osmundae IAM 14324]GAA99353.1 hypothetical protein E5Q_06048 [Mixia osmundae IAM 14324]